VALGRDPSDFVSRAKPGNATADNNDPFHLSLQRISKDSRGPGIKGYSEKLKNI
jgi:hypothetical protein